MDTRKLKHFLAVCEHGSGRKAADAIHLSQSALSRSIQALEEEVGAQLFDRIDQYLHITPYGRALQVRARRLLQEVNEIRRDMELIRNGEVGEIGLGMSPTPAALVQDICLTALARDHPGMKVSIAVGRTDELLDGLRAEKFDVVIVDSSAINDPEGLEIEQLPSLSGGFICRNEHPLASAKEVTVSDLRGFPVACSPTSDAMARELVSRFGEDAHPERLITIRCDSYPVQLNLMLASNAIVMSVFTVLRQELASGAAVKLKVKPNCKLLGHYALVRLAGRTLSPALTRVYESARLRFDQE